MKTFVGALCVLLFVGCGSFGHRHDKHGGGCCGKAGQAEGGQTAGKCCGGDAKDKTSEHKEGGCGGRCGS